MTPVVCSRTEPFGQQELQCLRRIATNGVNHHRMIESGHDTEVEAAPQQDLQPSDVVGLRTTTTSVPPIFFGCLGLKSPE